MVINKETLKSKLAKAADKYETTRIELSNTPFYDSNYKKVSNKFKLISGKYNLLISEWNKLNLNLVSK